LCYSLNRINLTVVTVEPFDLLRNKLWAPTLFMVDIVHQGLQGAQSKANGHMEMFPCKYEPEVVCQITIMILSQVQKPDVRSYKILSDLAHTRFFFTIFT
jgi:hypothetical protein